MTDGFENPEDVFNARDMNRPPQRREEPKMDTVVSEIVGKPIRTNNPKLIQLLVKWKQEKGDDDTPDNFFENEKFIEELKQTFN